MNVRTPLSDPTYYHGGKTSPAVPPPVAVDGSPHASEDTLGEMGWHELRALAKLVGVLEYAKMKRPALEAAIRSAQEAAGAGQ